MDKDAVVIATGFDQEHAHLGILAQAVGQHAARGTGTHNDVVKFGQSHVFSFLAQQLAATQGRP